MLVSCLTGGGNLLLNIGPMPTGEIEARQVALLKQVGAWVKPRAKAIYGTRGGPFANGKWGGSCHRGNIIYLFAKSENGEPLSLAPLSQHIKSARKLTDGSKVSFKQTDQGVELSLPARQRDTFFTLLALTLDQPVPDGTVVSSQR